MEDKNSPEKTTTESRTNEVLINMPNNEITSYEQQVVINKALKSVRKEERRAKTRHSCYVLGVVCIVLSLLIKLFFLFLY